MKSTSILISGLVVVLVGSNLWWFYKSVEVSVVDGYRQESLLAHRAAVVQLTAVSVAAAQPGATPESVLSAARGAAGAVEAVEDGNWTWVGPVAYRFDEAGHLAEIRLRGLRH